MVEGITTLSPLRGDGGANGIGVVSAISDEPVEAASGSPDHVRGRGHVVDVAGRRMSRRGQPNGSVSAWSLLVRPPREMPMACAKAPLLRHQRSGGP